MCVRACLSVCFCQCERVFWCVCVLVGVYVVCVCFPVSAVCACVAYVLIHIYTHICTLYHQWSAESGIQHQRLSRAFQLWMHKTG